MLILLASYHPLVREYDQIFIAFKAVLFYAWKIRKESFLIGRHPFYTVLKFYKGEERISLKMIITINMCATAATIYSLIWLLLTYPLKIHLIFTKSYSVVLANIRTLIPRHYSKYFIHMNSHI